MADLKLASRVPRRLVASALAVMLAMAATPGARAAALAARGPPAGHPARIGTDVRPAASNSVAERWLAALSAYRAGNYAQALERFASVAAESGQNDWTRAGANFWAARAASAGGDQPRANGFLKLAAALPHTFYGLIAEHRLVAATASPMAAPKAVSAIQFPRPDLAPDGGYTVSKALVYALVRQESRFDPAAIGGGAYGLMQLTPATASRLSGDEGFRREPRRLHEAGVNLKLGQVYVGKLLASVQGDLLQAMAAYNSGPGVLKKFGLKLDGRADSLMMIESLPVASARDFVERVMASYWIYRQIFGLASPTLDAAASGVAPVLASLDD